jgi:hypothetical protein
MECMAADRPILVARDAGATTQKHLNPQTGLLFEPTPEALANAIVEALEQRQSFAPRAYVLAHSGRRNSLAVFRRALNEVSARRGEAARFDDIDWDGRNERFSWGEAGLALLAGSIAKHQSLLARQRAARQNAAATERARRALASG